MAKRPLLRTFGLAAAAIVLVLGAGLWLAGPQTPGMTALAPLAAEAQTSDGTAETIEIQNFAIGAPDAKVQIVEYASFTCPHCATFHAAAFKPLKADYIDAGLVRFEYREVYFDRYGLWAAMVARCGGEMRYFGITDILFSTQSEWAASDDPATVVENLKKIGRTAGMDNETMDACLKDGATAQAMVTAFEANMQADDVQGTPTIFINGTKHSNMGYTALKELIDAELAK